MVLRWPGGFSKVDSATGDRGFLAGTLKTGAHTWRRRGATLPANWKRLSRRTHYWCSIIILAPFLVILISGMILQFKKQVPWIQPATLEGSGDTPQVSFQQILDAAKTVPQAGITGWDDISRLDVRPGKGITKIRAKSNWEIQVDSATGEILQVEYRRSDTIESIHDGSYFHEKAKPWLFSLAGLGLSLLCVTGLYMFLIPFSAKRRRREAAPSGMRQRSQPLD